MKWIEMLFAKYFARNHEKKIIHTWNIRCLVDNSFVQSSHRPSLIYQRLTDFWALICFKAKNCFFMTSQYNWYWSFFSMYGSAPNLFSPYIKLCSSLFCNLFSRAYVYTCTVKCQVLWTVFIVILNLVQGMVQGISDVLFQNTEYSKRNIWDA